MKVLITDDCQFSRELLALTIEGNSEIDFAENGEDAIKRVNEAIGQGAYYDLICLDISMPVMGGQDALRTIRAIETASGVAKATVFMITASSSPDDMIAAITEGECDDYLTKPVISKVFLELLKRHSLIS